MEAARVLAFWGKTPRGCGDSTAGQQDYKPVMNSATPSHSHPQMPGDWQGDLDGLLAQILFNCNVHPVAPRRQMSLKNNGLLIKSKCRNDPKSL